MYKQFYICSDKKLAVKTWSLKHELLASQMQEMAY